MTSDKDGLTCEQKCENLNRLLDIISQLVPTFLASEIRNECCGMKEIFQSVRQYFGFEQSESTFMAFLDIKLEEGERPERIYYRLRSHMMDNRLMSDSTLLHDGRIFGKNEEMSPTLKRWIVLHWLSLVHPGLPKLVLRTFSHDLQVKTLKDPRPQISKSMNALLSELNDADTSVAYSTNRPFRKFRQHHDQNQQ